MAASPEVDALEAQRDRIRQQLGSIGDLRSGTLVSRYMKCGKPNCRCAQDGAKGHGPYWLLLREVNGKKSSRSIPAAALDATREQLAEGRCLRQLASELFDVSEALCDARLKAGAQDTGKDKAKKSVRGGLRCRVRGRSRATRRQESRRRARLGSGRNPPAPAGAGVRGATLRAGCRRSARRPLRTARSVCLRC